MKLRPIVGAAVLEAAVPHPIVGAAVLEAAVPEAAPAAAAMDPAAGAAAAGAAAAAANTGAGAVVRDEEANADRAIVVHENSAICFVNKDILNIGSMTTRDASDAAELRIVRLLESDTVPFEEKVECVLSTAMTWPSLWLKARLTLQKNDRKRKREAESAAIAERQREQERAMRERNQRRALGRRWLAVSTPSDVDMMAQHLRRPDSGGSASGVERQ